MPHKGVSEKRSQLHSTKTGATKLAKGDPNSRKHKPIQRDRITARSRQTISLLITMTIEIKHQSPKLGQPD